MDAKGRSKSAFKHILSFRECSPPAGYLVRVSPHTRRKIDVIIDVFETPEKRHLIENK